ncbi:MAG TPA: RIP metalloprotease RseP [Chitinophagales bacterium]|nr:RIP metalloprotease RseP [Chitinophagales bacterium]
METLIRVAQFILSLSILVLLHEWGHYITARMFKTRVEKFYLFFDFLFPFPTVLNFALFKKKIGDTEYGLGWFPLGGYVKIAGMIDESMDEEAMKLPPKPDEFRSKRPYQRLIIMLGGIIVNILLAFVIYGQILYWYGESYMPVENVKYGFAVDSTARKIGLQDGDKIISHDGGVKFRRIEAIPIDMLVDNAQTLEIERNGEKKTLAVPSSIYKEILANKGSEFLTPIVPCVVDTLYPEMALAKAGGKTNDRILSLDTVPISYFHEFRREIKNFAGAQTYITVLRGADTLRLDITIPDSAKVGFMTYKFDQYFDIVEKKYTLLQSIPAGVKKSYETLVNYIKQFRIIFNRDLQGYKQVGSFFTIAKQFSPTWDWYRFWQLTAFLSIALAFVNLLPIPALDGGHALFTMVEMITGRAPSEKFLERAQVVGMIIIFGLMIFALGNDIFRLFMGKF